MNTAEQTREREQNIAIKSRNYTAVSGVDEVISFDETSVEIHTVLGRLAVIGEGLHITKLNLDSGELAIEGKIAGLYYTDQDSGAKKSGLFKRNGR